MRFTMILQYVFLASFLLANHAKSCVEARWRIGGWTNHGAQSEPIHNFFNGMADPPSKMELNTKRTLSTPEECARACKDNEEPRNCYYKFTLEYYVTMGSACKECKPNNTNQIKNVPQCQCIEADGFERGMLSINRMLPGPSIQVCQNDRIIVDVRNNIEGMEVTLHWHGIWQQGSQYYDGVPFLTQCPIPSGTTFRYQFVAGNPGTHFYHSHTGVQKIDGQYGSLIVRQPPSDNPHVALYDEDLLTHVILLSDWMHEMSIERFPGRIRNNPGQIPENVLINGKGRWQDPDTKETTSVQLESFLIQPGKRYRFRMINSFSSVCPAELTIEGHSLTLIAQDGEDIRSVPVDAIITSSGERVDFILKANQTVDAYWIQVRALGECADVRQNAILRYVGGPVTPQTRPPVNQVWKQPKIYNPQNAECDSPRSNAVCAHQVKSLTPIAKELLNPEPDVRIKLPFEFFVYNSNKNLFKPGYYPSFMVTRNGAHIRSLIDGISFQFPRVPPLSQNVTSSDTCNPANPHPECTTPPCQCTHTYTIKKDAVVEVIVYDNKSTGLAHPFHLHGHTFRVFKIGRFANPKSIPKYEIETVIKEHKKMLYSKNYTQLSSKDTVTVPDFGYVILRFKADNPGWWLFHCHFLYHVPIGMAVAFHVGVKTDLPPVPPMFPTCQSFTPDFI